MYVKTVYKMMRVRCKVFAAATVLADDERVERGAPKVKDAFAVQLARRCNLLPNHHLPFLAHRPPSYP